MTDHALAIATTIGCALAVAVLVAAEARRDAIQARLAKPLASALFVATGAILAPPHSPFAHWIVVGLVLGAIGDVLLMWERGFLPGLAVFLCGHLAYVVAEHDALSIHTWHAAAGWYGLIPIAGGLGVLAYLWPRLGHMRVPVIAYVAVIAAMVIGAIALVRVEPSTAHIRLVVGAVLFFASDLSVARDRFVAHGFANRAWGLPAYYAAQLLIAWALSPGA